MAWNVEQVSGTSADNTSAVTLDISEENWRHSLVVTTTGTVAAGTATVACDGQTISGSIDLTDPAPVVFEGFYSSVVVTPASFSADCTFTATIRSK